MKTLIIYHSGKHGNTERVAKAMADALTADLIKPTDVKLENISSYDLIGLVSGIKNNMHHESIITLAYKLPQAEKRKAFVFSTSMLGTTYGHKEVKDKLSEKGYEVVGEFSCKGYSTHGFIGCFDPIIGVLGLGWNKGRPNDEDIEKAKKFSQGLLTS